MQLHDQRQMNIIKEHKKIAGVCVLLLLLIILTAVLVKNHNASPYGSSVITEKELPQISETLRAAGLYNVDLFETWVYEYYESEEKETGQAYSDTDSLLAAMLLADDQIRCEKKQPYEGEYLKSDVYALEHEDRLIFLRDNLEVFTTLFGEMPVPQGGLEQALPANWKKHSIEFVNDKCSLVTVVSGIGDGKEAVAAEAGILVDCRDMEEAEGKGNYLFVEKPGAGEPFCADWLTEGKEITDILSEREYDIDGPDGQVPLVFVDDKLLGQAGSVKKQQ